MSTNTSPTSTSNSPTTPSPVTLSFLAPADRCNQRCPKCYLTEVVHEPVDQFGLAPADYATFVTQFAEAEIPIAGVTFQGYEVTLPRSWPYVEAVFAVTAEHDLCRSFITNGMLLDKLTDRVLALDPTRISVSLDGADASTNDRIRGLKGAFTATTESLRRFLRDAPSLGPRMAVVSCVYDEDNVTSLLGMPKLLKSLGIAQWALGFELVLGNGSLGNGSLDSSPADHTETSSENRSIRPAQPARRAADWLRRLLEAADREGVACYVNDEFGAFKKSEGEENEGDVDRTLRAMGLFDPSRLVRMDPLGYVRTGHEILTEWDATRARRWDPQRDNAVDIAGLRNPGPKDQATRGTLQPWQPGETESSKPTAGP